MDSPQHKDAKSATLSPDFVNGQTVLDEAKRLSYGDRNHDYGTPADNHKRTAALWSDYLGIRLTARDVCAFNILQKLSRERYRPKRDNLVDVCGYADNMDRCPEDNFEPPPSTEGLQGTVLEAASVLSGKGPGCYVKVPDEADRETLDAHAFPVAVISLARSLRAAMRDALLSKRITEERFGIATGLLHCAVQATRVVPRKGDAPIVVDRSEENGAPKL